MSKNIEAIYPLSPMQEGMLFHSLYDKVSRLYVEQLSWVARGRFDHAAFERAWQHVVDLVESSDTGKPLLLSAIDAVAAIRPREARNILGDLTDDDDEDISEAVFDALGMAEGRIESRSARAPSASR